MWPCKYLKPCPKQVQQEDLESKHLRNRPPKQGFDRQDLDLAEEHQSKPHSLSNGHNLLITGRCTSPRGYFQGQTLEADTFDGTTIRISRFQADGHSERLSFLIFVSFFVFGLTRRMLRVYRRMVGSSNRPPKRLMRFAMLPAEKTRVGIQEATHML